MKPDQKSFPLNRNTWKNPFVIAGIIALAYWVVTSHAQHALELLPYALLLLCPLMHIFMHRHHGHGNQGNEVHHPVKEMITKEQSLDESENNP